MKFNGTHNSYATDETAKYANGQVPITASSITDNNGAPRAGTHKQN
jgi:catalase